MTILTYDNLVDKKINKKMGSISLEFKCKQWPSSLSDVGHII